MKGICVVDIAPVNYEMGDHKKLLTVMLEMDFGKIKTRKDAQNYMLERIGEDIPLIQFLLTNLRVTPEKIDWEVPIEILLTSLPQLRGWPEQVNNLPFHKPSLFIYGANSNYVDQNGIREIQRLFPNSKFAKIEGAGKILILFFIPHENITFFRSLGTCRETKRSFGHNKKFLGNSLKIIFNWIKKIIYFKKNYFFRI